jgi:hypothetical protein
MIITTLAWAGLVSASIPTLMFLKNRTLFQPPPPCDEQNRETRRDNRHGQADGRQSADAVSVLIPARDEAAGIADAISASLASEGVQIEVVVLDDNSSDGTGEIVRKLEAEDPRVRLITGQPLPDGWNGKQFACYQLSQAACHERLVFIDADVRLAPDALARLAAYQDAHDAALLSAFPRQITGTWLEKWLIPIMHFILLGFLPIARMRQSRLKAYAAGCGQLFVTKRGDYETAGTHQAIRGSRHDGLKLPAAYRAAGLATDIVDGTPIASCRMYRSAAEVVRGLLKNASEGIASPRLIVPFSTILLGGSLVPWVALAAAVATGQAFAALVALAAVVVAHVPRAVAAVQLHQSWQGVVFHTPAVVVFVMIQWIAFANRLLGRQVAWRGRG